MCIVLLMFGVNVSHSLLWSFVYVILFGFLLIKIFSVFLFHTYRLLWFIRVNSKLSEYGVQRGSDGSVSVSDSVLVKVSGADEDTEKEVLVSWSLQVSKLNLAAVCCCWICSALTLLVVPEGFPACRTQWFSFGRSVRTWCNCRKEGWLTRNWT